MVTSSVLDHRTPPLTILRRSATAESVYVSSRLWTLLPPPSKVPQSTHYNATMALLDHRSNFNHKPLSQLNSKNRPPAKKSIFNLIFHHTPLPTRLNSQHGVSIIFQKEVYRPSATHTPISLSLCGSRVFVRSPPCNLLNSPSLHGGGATVHTLAFFFTPLHERTRTHTHTATHCGGDFHFTPTSSGEDDKPLFRASVPAGSHRFEPVTFRQNCTFWWPE